MAWIDLYDGVWYQVEKDKIYTLKCIGPVTGIAPDNLGQNDIAYAIHGSMEDDFRILHSHAAKYLSDPSQFIYLGEL